LRVAVPAGILSFIGVYIVVSILSRAGLLVMFGVQLSVPLTPVIAVSTLVIAMLLSIVSAVVAGWVFLRGDVAQAI